MKKYIIAFIIVLLLLAGFLVVRFGNLGSLGEERDIVSTTTSAGGGVVCMEEAMLCPDGTTVEREGPNCDFPACPVISGIKDCPQLAPVGPNFCPNGEIVSGGLDANGCQMAPKCLAQKDCVVGGCSSTLCGEEGEDLVSTCEYREEYQCYQQAVCERQATGKCGWTETSAFSACMMKYKN